jgi:hypothetical protein
MAAPPLAVRGACGFPAIRPRLCSPVRQGQALPNRQYGEKYVARNGRAIPHSERHSRTQGTVRSIDTLIRKRPTGL